MAEATQVFEGTSGGVNSKGVASLTIRYHVATLDEVFTVGSDGVLGLGVQSRSHTQDALGEYNVDVTYEGADPSGSSSGVQRGESGGLESFEFEPSFREEPIQSHPEWDSIASKYSGTVDATTGKVTFAKEVASRWATSGTSKGGGSTGANPMYGITTYLVLQALFRRTRIVEEIPADLLDEVGSIKSSLPYGLPTPAEHDWLVMPPVVRRRGNVYEIQDTWMLSKKGGWPPEVYKIIEF